MLLEVNRRDIADRRMAAAQIVEGFDPFEDFGSGLGVVGEGAAIDEFDLEGREEGFCARVVVAVAAAARGGGQAVGGELGTETLAGVLQAAIRMATTPSNASSSRSTNPSVLRGSRRPRPRSAPALPKERLILDWDSTVQRCFAPCKLPRCSCRRRLRAECGSSVPSRVVCLS